MLPPTAQPWLRKSSKTSEKCLHATYNPPRSSPCISGGDPGCPRNSPCKQTLTERKGTLGLGDSHSGAGASCPFPKSNLSARELHCPFVSVTQCCHPPPSGLLQARAVFSYQCTGKEGFKESFTVIQRGSLDM